MLQALLDKEGCLIVERTVPERILREYKLPGNDQPLRIFLVQRAPQLLGFYRNLGPDGESAGCRETEASPKALIPARFSFVRSSSAATSSAPLKTSESTTASSSRHWMLAQRVAASARPRGGALTCHCPMMNLQLARDRADAPLLYVIVAQNLPLRVPAVYS